MNKNYEMLLWNVNKFCVFYINFSEEIKGEKKTWITKVDELNTKAENLLGDALISASYICMLPPFNKISRCVFFRN